jgi:6-phosphogluconolactonase
MRPQPELIILPDPDALATHVADWLLDRALETKDTAAIALSGGSTPAAMYRRLAEPAFAGRFPWTRIHWFWGDERLVPQDHPRSNFRLAWTSFLSRVPAPPSNIHPVPTGEGSPEAVASAYERELQRFYGSDRLLPERRLFHINLLGLGNDGHFASLFPGCAALGERARWAAVTVNDGEPRITLTYSALESSRHAAFLVAGEGKSAILPRLIAGDPELPAGRFSPAGSLHIFADAAAAAKVGRTAGISRGTIGI